MGPKIENVGFSLVLPLLFEGSRAAAARQPNEKLSEPGSFWGHSGVVRRRKALDGKCDGYMRGLDGA